MAAILEPTSFGAGFAAAWFAIGEGESREEWFAGAMKAWDDEEALRADDADDAK